MLKKVFVLGSLLVLATACGGSEEDAIVKVKALQKNDKNLSCREILLEMNEAQFYDKMAHKSRGIKLKNVLMPLGYVSTYMTAEDAIGAAQARVDYLNKIYDILHCAEKAEKEEKQLDEPKNLEKPARDEREDNRRDNYDRRDDNRGYDRRDDRDYRRDDRRDDRDDYDRRNLRDDRGYNDRNDDKYRRSTASSDSKDDDR